MHTIAVTFKYSNRTCLLQILREISEIYFSFTRISWEINIRYNLLNLKIEYLVKSTIELSYC